MPGVDGDDPARVLVFGRQLDVRAVRTSRRTDDPDQTLSPGQVAGYLAKYATKSADDDTGASNNPTIAGSAPPSPTWPPRRRAAARRHAENPYDLLGKWVHMLGFRGHFASKSRRYSITLGALRRARQRAQAADRRKHPSAPGPSTSPPSKPTCSPTTTPKPPSSSATGTTSAPAGPPTANAPGRRSAARAREYDQRRAEQEETKEVRKMGKGDG